MSKEIDVSKAQQEQGGGTLGRADARASYKGLAEGKERVCGIFGTVEIS